jgi:hypothetical protein
VGVSHLDAGPITNTNLDIYDSGQNADIPYTVTAGNLVLPDMVNLWVATGTFTPGGTITTDPASTAGPAEDGDIWIDGVLNMGTHALSVGGNFTCTGNFSESGSPHVTTFTATSAGHYINLGTGNLDNVTFNGSGGGWSFSDTSNTIDGDITVTAGTVSCSNSLTVNGGDVTGKYGSMTTGDRWGAAVDAIKEFADNSGAAGLSVGLAYFPPKLGDECNVATYANLDVDIAVLPGNASAIKQSLLTTSPSGGTPMRPALEGGIDAMTAWLTLNPTHEGIVILVTDGDPGGCSSNTASDVANVAESAATPVSAPRRRHGRRELLESRQHRRGRWHGQRSVQRGQRHDRVRCGARRIRLEAFLAVRAASASAERARSTSTA